MPRPCHATTLPFPCCSHAVPLSCRSAEALDCLSHLIYVRPCLIHTCHAVPLQCHEYAFLNATSQGHGRFMAVSWQDRGGRVMACWWHVCDLSAYGHLPLTHPVPGSLLSEAYQSQMQWPVWNRAAFFMDEKKDVSACIIYSRKIMITV
jgi:hypothetical protein